MKKHKLLLDKSNQSVLVKKLQGVKMSKRETQKLHRTVRIIQKRQTSIENNKKNEEQFKKLFF